MYEAPEVVTIGNAHELILGVKPFLQNYIDAEVLTNRDERVEDIDETD
jgi:hypothetical protein